MVAGRTRILVVGGDTFIGRHITAALLAENATFEVMVRPRSEHLLGSMIDTVEWYHGDVWTPASLKGHGRGVRTVIHTVGSTQHDPAQGLTYHYLNFLSLRNVANMCVTDGVPRLVFVSAANAPWLPRQYLRAKREAESYIERVGLQRAIIRAPMVYPRGARRPLIFRAVSLASRVSPVFWRNAPMPADIFARGVARIALREDADRVRYFARDLWRLNTREERWGRERRWGGRDARREPGEYTPIEIEEPPLHEADTRPTQAVE